MKLTKMTMGITAVVMSIGLAACSAPQKSGSETNESQPKASTQTVKAACAIVDKEIRKSNEIFADLDATSDAAALAAALKDFHKDLQAMEAKISNKEVKAPLGGLISAYADFAVAFEDFAKATEDGDLGAMNSDAMSNAEDKVAAAGQKLNEVCVG